MRCRGEVTGALNAYDRDYGIQVSVCARVRSGGQMARHSLVSLLVALATLLVILAIQPTPAPSLAAVRGAGKDTAAMVSRQGAPPMAGPVGQGDFAGLVEIGGGRRMYLECRGSGGPTVVLEAGYRNDADIWSVEGAPGMTMVLPGVAAFARVCAYDRPGTILDAENFSRSDPVPMPRTARDIVGDLNALLHAASVPGPYVLVGHSFGGLFVRLYERTYPDQVAGLVLVDALYEGVQTRLTPAQWALYARFGFNEPPPGLEGHADLETIDPTVSLEQMRQAAVRGKTASALPVVVLSKGQPFDLTPWQPLPMDFPAALERAWRGAQDELAVVTQAKRHTIATESSHYVQVQQPALVIEAVRDIVGNAREGAPR
jgi:pimeloyl-ACP methyl ester carboxylesterase